VDIINKNNNIIKNITPKDMETILTDKIFSKFNDETIERVHSAYSTGSDDEKITLNDLREFLDKNVSTPKNKRQKLKV
jgi:acetyl-CoA carboxylase carboxyltransferase component